MLVQISTDFVLISPSAPALPNNNVHFFFAFFGSSTPSNFNASPENAAICIDNPKKIIEKLKYIKENPKLIKDYKVLARECLNRNHNPEQIHRMIETDFNSVCAGV